jgi:hypothetical protein
MNNIENGMKALQEKHDIEDKAKLDLSTALKQHILPEQKSGVPQLTVNLESLYQSMVKDEYSMLDDYFSAIKKQIDRIGDIEFKSLIQDKLDIIEAGLNDREVSKYNNASKAVKELKELL